MIFLATGQPDAEIMGEHIVLTVKSGKDSVQVALSLHQALDMRTRLHNAVHEAMQGFARPSAAAVIPLPTPRTGTK